MNNLQRLIGLFNAAGARDPECWAKSEINEDIPQLARFLFLRGAWRSVVPEGETNWIEAYRKPAKDPSGPLAGISRALNRLLASGIDPRDLTEVVRVMQYEVLFSVCYLMDDPYPAMEGIENAPPELSNIGWALFEIDEKGNVGRPIPSLHESVLETDPTGRKMRPGRSG